MRAIAKGLAPIAERIEFDQKDLTERINLMGSFYFNKFLTLEADFSYFTGFIRRSFFNKLRKM
jgi:hypothetical protein